MRLLHSHGGLQRSMLVSSGSLVKCAPIVLFLLGAIILMSTISVPSGGKPMLLGGGKAAATGNVGY